MGTLLALCLASPSLGAEAKPPSERTTPLFDFHSNFWVNLHQVLIHEAWLRTGKPNRQVQATPPLSAAHMSKKEAADWNAAVDFYSAHFANRPQHGDDQLIEMNEHLAEQPDDGAHSAAHLSVSLPPETLAILRGAAVVYRKYWWSAHNAFNHHWIASQQERLHHLGPELAAAMSKDLRQPWPAAPIRVDVCYYVVALGHAFTTLPPHTTLSGSNEGLLGFELLFHEAAHTFADAIITALSAEGRAQHKEVGDLWHATLFYTSGAELRRLLPAPEQASFTSYAYHYGVYNGGKFTYRHILETDWQAYLDGKIDFTDATHSMVADLP
jgi:hypothetical protein